MTKLNYHPHIDGVRAIAVLSVLFYHLEFDFIPGGFTGVDVFFVISGYLITRILYRDVQAGNFQFKRFYLRRLRRLGPALLAVLVITFAAAYLFLTPEHFQRFSGALITSVLSVSNIYFWSESGYFDANAHLKPLLHTWSLSVEEQFYLVWPALIFLARFLSARSLLLVFISVGAVSLIGAKAMTLTSPESAFFLMPFRIYEFTIGAAIALLPALTQLSNTKKEIVTMSGFALIGYSVLQFDSSTPFPDVYALVPCLGAACLIIAGDARLSGRILINPVSLYLGKISYSLYLVHWPIIVMYKHIRFITSVSERMGVVLLIMSLITAQLLYQYVENRFRHNNKQQPAYLPNWAWFAAPAIVCAASLHAYTGNGWAHRYDPGAVQAIGSLTERRHERNFYKEHESNLAFEAFDARSDTNVLVIGDSHATDFFNAMYSTNPDPDRLSLRLAYFDERCYYLLDPNSKNKESSARHNSCKTSFDEFLNNPLVDEASWIVISTRWDKTSLAYMATFIQTLQQRDSQVIVTGRTAEFSSVPSLLFKEGLVDDIEQRLAKRRNLRIDKLNEEVKQISESQGAQYLDKLPFMCDLATNSCDVVDANAKILYTDYGHWTLEGARYFGKRIWSDERVRAWLNVANKN